MSKIPNDLERVGERSGDVDLEQHLDDGAFFFQDTERRYVCQASALLRQVIGQLLSCISFSNLALVV